VEYPTIYRHHYAGDEEGITQDFAYFHTVLQLSQVGNTLFKHNYGKGLDETYASTFELMCERAIRKGILTAISVTFSDRIVIILNKGTRTSMT
jgi:hypothetical protein